MKITFSHDLFENHSMRMYGSYWKNKNILRALIRKCHQSL